MTALFGWLLALAFGAGGTWVGLKWALNKMSARQELNAELDRLAKELKNDEANVLARPRRLKRDVSRRLREDRDR